MTFARFRGRVANWTRGGRVGGGLLRCIVIVGTLALVLWIALLVFIGSGIPMVVLIIVYISWAASQNRGSPP